MTKNPTRSGIGKGGSIYPPSLMGAPAVLLAWCEAVLQLTFEQVTQQPEKPLTIGLG
jgi:hypothetical protein